MPIIKTKLPNLPELSKVIGSIDGSNSKLQTRPLCENIFDVQRSELFEALEQLRTAFWSDEVIIPEPQLPESNIVQQPEITINLKRLRSEPDEDDSYQQEQNDSTNLPSSPIKRQRLDDMSVADTVENESTTQTDREATPQSTNRQFGSKSLTSYTSLWPFKKILIRQIRNTTYKEMELISHINQIFQTKSKDQCRHMSLYLLPVAQSMRKKHIIDLLNKWL